jgi:uncharacterized membrane protein
MLSDLIVVTFRGEDGAGSAFEALPAMAQAPLACLDCAAAIVTEDSAGQVRYVHERHLPETAGAVNGQPLSILTDLIFGAPSDELVLALSNAGFDAAFLTAVAGRMGNNTSALLFLVSPDCACDADDLVKALGLFKGRVHRTTLLPEAEAVLRKAPTPEPK